MSSGYQVCFTIDILSLYYTMRETIKLTKFHQWVVHLQVGSGLNHYSHILFLLAAVEQVVEPFADGAQCGLTQRIWLMLQRHGSAEQQSVTGYTYLGSTNSLE